MLILLVEDSIADAQFVQELIDDQEGLELQRASTLSDGIDAAHARSMDVTLLDLSLPDCQGLATFERFQTQFPRMPVVVLTGLEDEHVAADAVRLGAQDYLTKRELSDQLLFRSLRYAVERKRAEELSLHTVRVEHVTEREKLLRQREAFMAIVAHDLKNPLIGADRLIELLLQNAFGSLTDEQRRIVQMLKQSNQDQLAALRNLLETYRYEKGTQFLNFTSINLAKLIASCIEELQQQAQHQGLTLSSTTLQNLCVNGDTTALRHVVNNLMHNAIKFTPAGGSIGAAVRAAGESVSVSISDNGHGISAADLDKLFQPFSQGAMGKRFSAGSGLGLYLCRQIVEAHGGTISCSSSPGEGTSFVILLPAQAEAAG